jgi:hypothetical protein
VLGTTVDAGRSGRGLSAQASGSSIDVNEKLIVEVLTPYQGKIRGQALFTIDGPRPLGRRLKPGRRGRRADHAQILPRDAGERRRCPLMRVARSFELYSDNCGAIL